MKNTPDTNRASREKNQGMTLIEVMLALSILTAAILFAMSSLMNTITANRLMTADATANAVVLHQKEEVQEIAASDPKAPAAAIIKHYASLAEIDSAADDNGIAVGPGGAPVPRLRWDTDARGNRGLVYTFEVPGPAETVSGDAPFNRGFGEMLIYLNETAVPDTVTWNDLGAGTGGAVGAGSGYDINGDGAIGNALTDGAKNDLKGGNFAAFNEAVGPLRLPVDISVFYFADASHTETFYDTTRRSVFIGLNEPWHE